MDPPDSMMIGCRNSSTLYSSVLEELRENVRLKEEIKQRADRNPDSLTKHLASPYTYSTCSPARNPYESLEAGNRYQPLPQLYPNTNPFAYAGEPCRSPWTVQSESYHEVETQSLPQPGPTYPGMRWAIQREENY